MCQNNISCEKFSGFTINESSGLYIYQIKLLRVFKHIELFISIKYLWKIHYTRAIWISKNYYNNYIDSKHQIVCTYLPKEIHTTVYSKHSINNKTKFVTYLVLIEKLFRNTLAVRRIYCNVWAFEGFWLSRKQNKHSKETL